MPKSESSTSPAAGHHEADVGQRTLHGGEARLVAAIAIAFSTFQMYTAAFNPLSSIVVRSVHVGFLTLLAFVLYPGWRGAARTRVPVLDWLLGLSAFVLGLYQWVFETDLILRAGEPNLPDLVAGTLIVVVVFEAARRVMGPALPIICALFLAYGLFGQHLPEGLAHRGYGYDQIVSQLALGTEGIYGIATLVSSSYIFLFILFGAFLEQAGMSRLFTDVALGLVGRTRGGPGKVAVISSALMGTINGSGVANVLTTGQFTIPLMKRFGFRPAFAGAVEATASMGGQIMPPVMGAVAFIMAETLDVPYLAIVQAAIVPAILYFVTVLWTVQLEAGRQKLAGLKPEDCPDWREALIKRGYLLLPLAGLVYLIMAGYTPMFAAIAGLALTAILILGGSTGLALNRTFQRLIFWVSIGVASAAFFKFGIVPVLTVIALLVGLNILRKGGRATLHIMYLGLVEGAKSALSVGIACAIVGVIVGILTLTGVASSVASVIVEMAKSSLFLSLFVTMLICLILGMGIPTIPNYIITSSIAGPALLKLGVPLLVSHMFVFYFGIMADLTPPVALAAFAASSIAKTSAMRIGLNCLRVAIAGFVVPFMAVYAPALMLQSNDLGAIAYVIFKALVAIGLWGVAAIGYFRDHLGWPERILAAAGAFFLVAALPVTDEIGFALAIVFLAWQALRRRRTAKHA
jgi:TRAP transporter 4TM/12TM fusion protein